MCHRKAALILTGGEGLNMLRAVQEGQDVPHPGVRFVIGPHPEDLLQFAAAAQA
jgi:hypothetical protein